MEPDRLIALVAAALEIDPAFVTEESGMNQTENWDSLKNFLIMADIERAFDVKLDFDTYEQVTTVGAIRALLKGKGVTGV